jgi:DNA-binding transcriptional LysR family regulator
MQFFFIWFHFFLLRLTFPAFYSILSLSMMQTAIYHIINEFLSLFGGIGMDAIKCEALLAAAALGSMTAAAEQLGYTQSGITRMVHALEEELGFPLLARSKGGVELTENGKLMLPALREIVRADENARQLGAEICGVVTGVLTVGSYYSVSAMLMPKIISIFKTRYPGIRIRILEGGNREMAEWLREKTVDCCFGAKPTDDILCDWVSVFQDELVAWLPESSPRAKEAAFPLKALESEPFIQTSPDCDTDQDRLLRQFDLHPDIRFTTRDGFATYNMVAAGLGISFNQKLISRDWNGGVVELPFYPPQYISLGISIPSRQEASPAVKRFISCVKEMAAAQ